MTRVAFTVLGRPQPAGSKRAFRHAKSSRVIVVDDNPKSKPWKQEIAGAARNAVGPVDDVMRGPLVLEARFILARPKGHYGTGRNAGTVKASAPRFPTTKPDTTKLLRCLEDALTGVVWHDDAQIVAQYAWKEYGAPERCEIVIRDLVHDGMAEAA